jgi:hypothetical protein
MRFALAVFALLPVAVIAETHPFNVHDLVMMDRVSDPQISPDGKRVAYQLRETDYAENKGVTSVWIVDLAGRKAEPVNVSKQAGLVPATSPRWSPDGQHLYVLGKGKDDATTQVWQLSLERSGKGDDGRTADHVTTVTSQMANESKTQLLQREESGKGGYRRDIRRITNLPLDVGGFKLSPDGRQILLSVEVFTDCDDLACTKKRNDEKRKQGQRQALRQAVHTPLGHMGRRHAFAAVHCRRSCQRRPRYGAASADQRDRR